LSEIDTALFLLKTQALFVLGLHSLYKTVDLEAKEAMRESRQTLKPPQVILERFRSIIEQRDVAITVLIVSILAAVAWIVNTAVIGDQLVQVWGFSLALVEGLILFFVIESFYLVLSRWLAPSLRSNRLFVRAVDASALTGALLISLSSTVGCMLSLDLSCSIQSGFNYLTFAVFFIVFFVSGLGAMGIVATLSDSISSHLPNGSKENILYLGVLFGSMIGVIIFSLSRGPLFGPGTGFSLIGAELAIVIGFTYLSYLLIKRRESQESSSLVYAIMMFGLAGIFADYTVAGVATPNLSLANPFPVKSPTDLVLLLILFGIGYFSLVLEMPRSVEHRLGIKHARLVATVTFLMVFAVVGNFQLAIFSGLGTGAFVFQKEAAIITGLWVGTIVLTARKIIKIHQKGKLRMDSIVPFCGNCGSSLESSSKFCPKCGSSVSSQPEKVLFVGDGQLISSRNKHHSTKRKLGSLVAGGPLGYLAFGMDFPLQRESEGQVAVTDRAVYFGGNPYPLNRIVNVKPGHYSNSVILAMKQLPTETRPGISIDTSRVPLVEVELKTSNVKALVQTIEGSALAKL